MGGDRRGAPRRGPSTWRAALAGALAGAVVAALVAGGIVLAAEDDDDGTGVTTAAPTSQPAETGSNLRRDAEPLDVQGILARVESGLVAIETRTSGFGAGAGAGSGVVLDDDGLILTNAHVVAGAARIAVVLPDGSERPAELVGSLPTSDIALVRVADPAGLVAVTLGSSTDLRVGDDVVAIGNALNLGATPTVTTGIVSALNRTVDLPDGGRLSDLIQTDAAINPGNSGGALVNAVGEVVGINTAVAGGAENIGFAIAIDGVRPLLDNLSRGEIAFLGVSSVDVGELAPAILRRFGIPEGTEGAFLSDVGADTPAARAGLQEGDVVTAIGDVTIESAADLVEAITASDPGATVTVTWLRAGERTTADVELSSRPTTGG
jgi:putative serine protease PepD